MRIGFFIAGCVLFVVLAIDVVGLITTQGLSAESKAITLRGVFLVGGLSLVFLILGITSRKK